jgi:16S rRNA (adenine1518-N6/adenine1519-N6)-dimethyltransferase
MTRRPLGQNFLVSERWARKLVEALEIPSGAGVLEIGPGKGMLTRLLLERGHRVVAIEKDASLAPHLEREGLTLFVEDASVFPSDIPAFVRKHAIQGLLGNLPYYVASHLLLRFLPYIDIIGPMVLTFQKEVAEKILAEPGNRDHGALAVLAGTWSRRERLGTLPPGAFRPIPKVESAVVRLRPRTENEKPDFERFSAFLRQAFASPRKTLMNNLKGTVEPEHLKEWFASFSLPPSTRPHQVDAVLYRRLFDQREERL